MKHFCAGVQMKRKERLVSRHSGDFGYVYQVAQSFTKTCCFCCPFCLKGFELLRENTQTPAYFGPQRELLLITLCRNNHMAAGTDTVKTHLL